MAKIIFRIGRCGYDRVSMEVVAVKRFMGLCQEDVKICQGNMRRYRLKNAEK